MWSRLALLKRLPVTLLVAVGLLAQGMLAPQPFASPASDPFWALGGICGPGQAGSPKGPALPDHRQCQCTCCKAGPASFLLPVPPSARPSAWVATVALAFDGVVSRFSRSRLAYASRAPPAVG